MKKTLLLLLSALLPLALLAETVTETKARAVAEQFFASAAPRTHRSLQSPSLRLVWNGEPRSARSVSATAPAFYVYNNETDKGFVIVSGDDRTVAPILGYSLDQHFDAENMPQNLNTWMTGIREEINEARQQGLVSVRREVCTTSTYKAPTPVKELATALWDQRAPYNSKLPLGYVTGCPATAIAIIMRYHRWPEKGVGTIPQSNEKIGSIKLGHTYDWDNMPMTYNDLPTQYQKDQVGTLMRDVGAMVRTQYGGGTAGANPEETLPQLMPIYMRYNAKTIKSVFKKNFPEEEWHTMMQKEIKEDRPVLYGGYSSGGGHQFVIDGYATDHYYHVNWGWSGVSNGYYLLTVMNPPEQGAGGSSSADGFTKRQDAIIGIQPDSNNPGGGYFDLISYKPFASGQPYGMIVKDQNIQQGVAFQLTLKEYQNKGSREFRGRLAIAHFSADGIFKGTVSDKDINYSKYPMQINDYTESNTLNCVIREAIEPGDYISGVFKFQNPSDWTPIRNGYLENTNCTEKIVLKEGAFTVTTTAGGNLSGRALSTFSSAYATTPSHSEVEAYWAEHKDGDKVILRKIEPQGGHLVVPANTGVMLSTPAARTFTMNVTAEEPANVDAQNLLCPTNESPVTVATSDNAYILSKQNDQLLFYRLAQSNRTIAAHRAYLVLPVQTPANSLRFVFDEVSGLDEITTALHTDAPIYDLSGRVVTKPLKEGIYIQSGKKFMIR